MSQLFDFDGAFQTPAPSIFTMETGGGGEGGDPPPTPPPPTPGAGPIGRRRGLRMHAVVSVPLPAEEA